MAKVQSIYVCQQCGYQSSSWLGKCPQCQTWGSLVETVVDQNLKKESVLAGAELKLEKLAEVQSFEAKRLTTGFEEFDRVLGGGPPNARAGIVPGSVVLLAGDPGIGKSTLLLQVAKNLAASYPKKSVLYISGEESTAQLKLRADRILTLGKSAKIPNNLFALSQNNVEDISRLFNQQDFSLVVVDSIQTMVSDELSGQAGSVGQVRFAVQTLHQVAKALNIPLFLVGHVTKEGAVAGPRVVEHLVDVVLYLEGEEFSTLRVLRSIKNRFGSVSEVGIFEMTSDGLSQVSNPSKLFLAQRRKDTAGSVVVPTLQGRRPILAEIQALTTPTSFGLPRRVATGVDYNRLLMIIAVLSKRAKFPLSQSDIYVNVAGGLKVFEPACDLGIALSIVSAIKFQSLPPNLVALGEIGLLGEVREVVETKRRIEEAKKLGFRLFLTKTEAKTLEEAIRIALKAPN